MRIEIPAKDVRPGDQIWFGGARRPSPVLEVAVQDGAEKLVVLTGESSLWYLPYATGSVFRWVEDEAVEAENEAQVFEDPDGNPV